MALDPTRLISPDFSNLVGARPSKVNPAVAEYYNTTDQTAFNDPNALAQYVNTKTNRTDLTGQNVFDVLKTTTPQTSINQAYQNNVGVRQLAGQNQFEYFNPANQQALANPEALAEYFNTTFNRQDANAGNIFDLLKATPPTRLETLQNDIFKPQTPSINIYDEEYNNAGLNNLKSQLGTLDDEITRIRAGYTTKQGDINENPWLSEASRTGRMRILTDQMNAEIGNLINQKERLGELYNLGMNELQLRVGLRTDDQTNLQALKQQEFEFLLNQQTNEAAKQEVARAFAIDNEVTAPYYQVGGTVYRTSDGYAFTSEADFFSKTGETNWDNVQQDITTPEERERAYNQELMNQEFNQDLAMQSAKSGNATGSDYWSLYKGITGMGSSEWANGVDADLEIGDPVYTPASGQVIYAGENGGFGNQVKIRTDSGEEVWLSHLSQGNVKVGDRVTSGQIVGLGGNTGNVIPGKGNNGSHLDFTVKRANGSLMSANEAHAWANQVFSGSPNNNVDPKVQARNDENQVFLYFSNTAGNDGFVSPEDWHKMKEAWIQDSYSVSDFYNKFKQYINPANPQDYN